MSFYIQNESLLHNLVSECGIRRFSCLMDSGVLLVDTLDNMQLYTSGSGLAVASGVNVLFIDPPSVQATLEIILPVKPAAANEIDIFFGGAIGSGTVIQSLLITPHTGQTIIEATHPSLVKAGEVIAYQWRPATATWYRKI
jgi:hypothetical protein